MIIRRIQNLSFRRLSFVGGVISVLSVSKAQGFTFCSQCQRNEANVATLTKAPVTPFVEAAGVHETLANLYQNLRSILSKIHQYIRIFFRSWYLAVLYTPALLLMPLLDSPRIEIRSIWWSYLRETLIRSGPCIAKFAQWVCSRPDLIPEEGIDFLKSLMSNKRGHITANEIETMLDNNFGPSWRDSMTLETEIVGTSGELQALIVGSGCVAQVVKAHWHDGSDIAIKFIHTDVHNLVLDDISIIRYLVNFIGNWLKCSPSAIDGGFDEFADMMTKQLDLTTEATNLLRFRANFKSDEMELKRKCGKDLRGAVTFPKPMYPLVSSTVLVETYSEGDLLAQLFDNESSATLDKKLRQEIAYAGFHAVLKMIFEDNFVHIGKLCHWNCHFISDRLLSSLIDCLID